MPDLVQRIARRPADGVLGWRGKDAVTNGDFLSRVAVWRQLLARLPGQNFALYHDDSLEFGAALLAAWQQGKTIWLTSDTLAASCAALALSVDGFLGQFKPEWSPATPDIGDEPLVNTQFEAGSLPDGELLALVVHTSGTSGVAQAVPKRLSQLLTEVETLESVFGADLADSDVIATVSHQHIYGLLFKLLWPLSSGRAIHAYSQNYPEELCPLLARRPCLLISSPAHLKRLPEHLAWAGAKENLRAIFSSGGPLAPEVAQSTCSLLGQIPIEVYGSSETGGIAWRQRATATDGSWRPLPQVEWRISDGEQLLEVRSPHLFNRDWLQLPDRVQADADLQFLLLGRSDRIVKIEEKRISIDAIEGLLKTSDLVSDARILVCELIAGQRQRLAAFIVLTEMGKKRLQQNGKHALNQLLRRVLADAIEPVALPRRWRYLEQMPLNAQGKTTHAALLALLVSPDVADLRPCTAQLQRVERDGHRVVLELFVPAKLRYFEGHFKNTPVLPGVVLVDWAIAYGQGYFQLQGHFSSMQALKFHHVVLPDSAITLELLYDPIKNSLSFRYFSEREQHSSGRLLFRRAQHRDQDQEQQESGPKPLQEKPFSGSGSDVSDLPDSPAVTGGGGITHV